jgi:hypothetical protein
VNTRTKLISAAVAALAISGGIGATIATADTPTPAPDTVPSSPTTAKPHQNAQPQRAHKALLKRALHGEVTLGGKRHQVVDFQRGTVLKVDGTSVTVRSADGFTKTYLVNAKTKVRKEKAAAQIADVKATDKVRVVAVKDGSTVTAKAIGDRGAGKR